LVLINFSLIGNRFMFTHQECCQYGSVNVIVAQRNPVTSGKPGFCQACLSPSVLGVLCHLRKASEVLL
ncbi:MAG: hypothetical protein ACREPR_04155, partial [Brasilonema sp.]